MAWTPPRTWISGEIVTATLLNTHVRDNLLDLADGSWGRDVQFVVKDTSEDVVNSATPQSDDQLLFTATANARYVVDVVLFVEVSGASSASDIKIGWSLPSGSFHMTGPGPDVAMPSASAVGSGRWDAAYSAAGATISYGLFSTGTTGIRFITLVQPAGTGGTVAMQWAQNTATAGVTTTVKSGSFLRAERIE